MAEQKPSGIRPPSKIGRPCSNLPPRPAVPPSPPKASMNQMDHLWETHGRRLSEAGLRRGSDNSVVLTEDTDSFIIGDRVWVGGTKPGSIAYIGETQFAPGDWAGVVLDEPIGKNDGSVAGCRYFQCEPKRGIFSRLTRLTREPLMNASAMFMQKSPTTPTESIKGSLGKSMSPSLNASTTSLSSTMSTRDLRLGERVIVSSSQGSKTGVLRYVGITDFAPGEWCGVELDEPIGKNDGSVDNKRYFECRFKYGLFAPTHKVSRSPTSKRTSCIVHKPTGASLNASVRKTDSMASLTSITSTASTSPKTAATARRPGLRTSTSARISLQETLKEKQQEIEILRRERDLERERATKAANQVDHVEQSVVSIKQEYEEKMQKTVTEAEIALSKLLEEKNALTLQLEEEKRKYEDLLFRFEEESVNKDDIQIERTEHSVINTVNENRIKDLEKQLLEERERVAQLEHDSIKLFETEEELARLRNEASNTNAQEKLHLEDLQNKNKTLEETRNSLEKEVEEKSALVEQCAAQIKELELKLEENQNQSVSHKESETNLRTELEQVRKLLQEKILIIENMKQEFESSTNIFKEELERARESIENVKKESANEKELLTSKYEKIVEEKENLIKVKAEALETESKKHLEVQNVAFEDLKAENLKQISQLSESFNEQLSIKDSKIKEVSMQLDQKISETEKLIGELATQLDLSKKKDGELNVALQKVEELHEKLKLMEEKNAALTKQIQEYQSQVSNSSKLIEEKEKLEHNVASLMAIEANSSAQLKKLSEELKEKEKELSELRSTTKSEIEELTKHYQDQIQEKSKSIERANADISQKSMLLSKLEKDINELRSLLADKDEEIKSLTEKTLELQDALTLSEETKTNLESELRVFEGNMGKLNEQVANADNKISQLTSQKEKLELDISQLLNTSADSSEQLVKYNDDLRVKEKELDELKEKAFKTENTLKSIEGKLCNAEEELNKANGLIQEQNLELQDSKLQLKKEKELCAEMSNKIKEFETENIELKKVVNENEQIKETLKEKSQVLLNLESELKSSKEQILGLQTQCDSLQSSNTEEVSSIQKEFNDLKLKLVSSQEEIKALQKIKSTLEADISGHRWSIEELTEKLAAEVENRSKLESSVVEKDSKLQDMETKYSELQKANEALVVSKETTDQNLNTSINTMSNEIKELKEKLNNAAEVVKTKEDALNQMKKETQENETQISKLNDTIASLKEEQGNNVADIKKIQEVLSKKEKEVNDVIEAKNSLETNIKDLESQLQTVRDELNTKNNTLQEMERTIEGLKNSKDESVIKLQNTLENEMKSKITELQAVVQKNSELQQKEISLQDFIGKQNSELSNKEAVINQLTAQVRALEDAQSQQLKTHEQARNDEINIIQSKLDVLNKENKNLIDTKATLEKLVGEREQSIEVLTNTMKNKEKEAERNMQNLMEKLNVISSESAKLREAQSNLEKENKQISAKWTEATNQLKLTRENMKNNYDAAGGDTKQHIVEKDIDNLTLKEEYETAKSQIEFLNSVIVDMQRKNETLMCKVEVLEMGVPANEADDYTKSTLDKRMAAPRMFCDICDTFDLHETEDCPRQGQDYVETEKVSKSPKKVSVERPYCENCEIFGHDTRDCDDAETF